MRTAGRLVRACPSFLPFPVPVPVPVHLSLATSPSPPPSLLQPRRPTRYVMSTPTLMPTLMLSCSSCQPHMLARSLMPSRFQLVSLPSAPRLAVYNIRASCCSSRDFGRFPPPIRPPTYPLMRSRRLATLACCIFPFLSPPVTWPSGLLVPARTTPSLTNARLVIRALRRRNSRCICTIPFVAFSLCFILSPYSLDFASSLSPAHISASLVSSSLIFVPLSSPSSYCQ